MKKLLVVSEEIERCIDCFYYYKSKSFFIHGCNHPSLKKIRILDDELEPKYYEGFPTNCPLEDV